MSSCVAALILLLAAPAAAQHGGGVRGTGAPPSTEYDPAIFPGIATWQRDMEVQGWLFRGQATFVEQGHPAFRSPYRGANSLQPAGLQRNTFSTDLVVGRRLWEGAEIVADPQISRGFGLSGTRGVAAFPNGEAFRIGTEAPSIYLTRLFVRQTIGLSDDVVEDDSPLRFATPVPRERITLTAGKIAVFDVFDDNRYAHDPRTQFLNWAFTSAGLSLNGAPWGRAGDTVGLAGNIGGLSAPHRRFLAAGGLGFILGDGRLTYRPETVMEAYYAATVAPGTLVTGDVQFIANPAHNADRGPVAVFSLRLHTEF